MEAARLAKEKVNETGLKGDERTVPVDGETRESENTNRSKKIISCESPGK